MSSKVQNKGAKRKSSKSKNSDSSEQSIDDNFDNMKNIQLNTELREKLNEFPEVLVFIDKLQKIIKKQVKKIIKWKRKAKQIQEKNVKNAATQTSYEYYLETPSSENQEEATKVEKTLADDIREAAEQAMQSSGFVYEETSGLYYDYNSGYYYNAEYGLYYDGTTGTYLKYNAETQSYEFHSQVETSEATSSQPATAEKEHKPKRKSKKKQKQKETKRRRYKLSEDDLEEGECSDESATSNEDSVISESSDLTKQWPPCMRLIVETTEIPKLKSGSLFIITCDGGTIGREGNHSICLPDINVSKHHLKISYDIENSKYMLIDLGSRNGTLLNGKRISSSKQESEAIEVQHGSKIQLGSSVLLCHIHEGTQTCGHCEPGLLLEDEKNPLPHGANKKTINQQFKSELKRLRKHHGLLSNESTSKLGEGYMDRAQKRREEVGSQNPYEKTEAASVEESISSENKGFKLLAKMGWKEGQSLGKEGTGVKEPINVVSNIGTTGIGAATELINIPDLPKKNVWKKTRERFDKLPEKADIIDNNDSD